MEIPDISKKVHRFPQTDYTTCEFLALEILTSEDAKKKVQFPISFHIQFFIFFLFFAPFFEIQFSLKL